MNLKNLTKRIAICVLLSGIALASFGQRITSSQIQYWVGSGSNEAILIVNFCNANIGLAYGYRFNGTPTALSMLAAINTADSRLNISGPPTSLGGYSYTDATYNLTETTPAPYMAVNDLLPDLYVTIANGDIIELGGSCANTGWTYPYPCTFSTPVTPVSNPNPPQVSYYTIHSKSGDEWATQSFGTISPLGDSTVAEGASITYHFTPNAGYHIASVMLGSNDVTSSVSNNTYTLSNITHNDTIWSKFAVDKNNTITANDILYWVGSGSNQVIFAVNWCNPQKALAWGYRFDGQSVLVAEVMQAIKDADSRFDYDATGGYINQITYSDNTDNLSFSGYIAYNVNEEAASMIGSQQVRNNDIIEVGGVECALSDDFWNSVWTMAITPVSIPENALNDIANEAVIYSYYEDGENFVSIGGVEGKVTMTIFDMNGKPVEKESFYLNSTITKRIATNKYSKGMYFIQLQVNEKVYLKKLIVC